VQDGAADGPGDAGDAGDATDTGAGADANSEAAAPVPTFLAHFSKANGELPEGLWEIPAASGSVAVVGFAPTGKLVTVANDGTVTSFGGLPGTVSNIRLLGIVTDAAGSLYVAVAGASAGADAGDMPSPTPGIFKLAADGGDAVAFSQAATPPMSFPNGLDRIGTALFVTDSANGVIYKVDAAGNVTVWKDDPLFKPDRTACGGAVGADIGANGIAHDQNNFYVTNTNQGIVARVSIQSDGDAGAASLVAQDCATLAGADGVTYDAEAAALIVAVNAKNQIAKVTLGGAVSILASGTAFDTPASVFLEADGGSRRLLVTNAAFNSPADGGAPGLLAIPLP
jgi:sugar lactone lactonase YvrE